MRSWTRPDVPRLAGMAPPPRIWDASQCSIVTPASDEKATLYVCGITPYDATHLGHAATYLAFDILIRAWIDAGMAVTYVQNSTDVDDPLLDRARETGVDWRQLAATQTELFRSDMEALRVVPPEHYVAVSDVIPEVAVAVDALLVRGLAYEVPTDDAITSGDDLYFDIARAESSTDWRLGTESRLDRPEMLELSAERGGDPARPGKRDPLDPLLWRVARAGEPAWSTVLGEGRPGWHVECSVIAVNRLGAPLSVHGGGSDLAFPHHEFSSAHATALTGEPFADAYAHAGMVGYRGEKMSKSLGNLVLVSDLISGGVDPRALRLALLSEHYRTDREWTDATLSAAEARLRSWNEWAADPEPDRTGENALTDRVRAALGNDLDTPAAITAVDDEVRRGIRSTPAALDAIHALLGIDLR